ncbi:MAG: AMP-binding protein [Burkholderiaceae bacterium]
MSSKPTSRARPAASTGDAHARLYADFRWQVPHHFNLYGACCARWARETPEAVAVVCESEAGEVDRTSYAELNASALRLAAVLQAQGVARGDRVAIVLPQCVETAVAHMAVSALGAVAMPLSMLFGPEALGFRLRDSDAVLAIADSGIVPMLLSLRPECPALRCVLSVGGRVAGAELAWQEGSVDLGPLAAIASTRANDPAVLIYTSGTTGAPKGALIPQRALVGNLSGFVCSQNWFPHHARMFWSPADWAWTGGLMDALLPTLYFGQTILGSRGRFSAERSFELMQRHGVTHSFLFPTALKAMMKAVPAPRDRYPGLRLRALMSAGEAVGDAVFSYCRDALGVTVNEMFGQTEINYIVGNCASYVGVDGRTHPGWPARPGSMGRPYPGHRIAVLDDAGNEVPRGTPGDVAVHRRDLHGHPDPVFFLGYWNNEAATRGKFTGDPEDSWCRTGDTALMDDDGYLWYQGRSDDMFKAAGYRIGPSEVENCLVKHPAVANAAVVPKPDAERGAVVKAYVVLAAGFVGDAALIEALQQHVRGRLAPYEYPKEIEFIDALPMTTTGKVQRRVLRLQEEERAKLDCNPAGKRT